MINIHNPWECRPSPLVTSSPRPRQPLVRGLCRRRLSASLLNILVLYRPSSCSHHCFGYWKAFDIRRSHTIPLRCTHCSLSRHHAILNVFPEYEFTSLDMNQTSKNNTCLVYMNINLLVWTRCRTVCMHTRILIDRNSYEFVVCWCGN